LPYELFEKIELTFNQRKELFTINLNEIRENEVKHYSSLSNLQLQKKKKYYLQIIELHSLNKVLINLKTLTHLFCKVQTKILKITNLLVATLQTFS
jgi:hypothetical protein